MIYIKNPIRIYGSWDEGFDVDNHMLKSEFLGYDDNQKEIFENTRTEIGELVYKFKYQKNKDCLKDIVDFLKEILDSWNLKDKINLVIPVPPSNKKRLYQPVFEIAKAISEYLEKECKLDLLIKNNNLQVKDGNNVKGTIKPNTINQDLGNILIIDDLFSTGATLNEVCKVLKSNNNVGKIYCLVLTKTKR